MAKAPPKPKRANRSVQLGEMIGKAIDPALKKRGFASRDLIANWPAIAPTPYDTVAIPDKLVWPRKNAPDPEGATLYLRCLEGHALGLAHEGDTIAGAINRYFGYFLVARVKLSSTPYRPTAAPAPPSPPPLDTEQESALTRTLSDVQTDELRAALEKLGRGVLSRRGK